MAQVLPEGCASNSKKREHHPILLQGSARLREHCRLDTKNQIPFVNFVVWDSYNADSLTSEERDCFVSDAQNILHLDITSL